MTEGYIVPGKQMLAVVVLLAASGAGISMAKAAP
jgi:hypothetical protein